MTLRAVFIHRKQMVTRNRKSINRQIFEEICERVFQFPYTRTSNENIEEFYLRRVAAELCTYFDIDDLSLILKPQFLIINIELLLEGHQSESFHYKQVIDEFMNEAVQKYKNTH